MAVNDGVALVAAAGGLVNPHAVEREHVALAGKGAIKRRYLLFAELAVRGHLRWRPVAGRIKRCGHIRQMRQHAAVGALLRQPVQQTVKQRGVAAGTQRQMHIGDITAGGAARIDHHHLHRWPLQLRLHQPLPEHRVRPGGIGTAEDHQIGMIKIRITARHGIGAKSALVAHHCGGHTEPRIGVDVARTDKSLHQLVSDIIIFGQQLTGSVKRHRLRAMLVNDLLQSAGYRVERGLPADAAAVDMGIAQPARLAQRVGQRGAFHTEPTRISRMFAVAADLHCARARRYRHAAADAAIGAGAVHDAAASATSSGALATHTMPPCSFTGQQRSRRSACSSD